MTKDNKITFWILTLLAILLMLVIFLMYSHVGEDERIDEEGENVCFGFTFFYVPIMVIISLGVLYKELNKEKEDRG